MRMGKKKLLQFTAIVMCLICLTGCGAGPALPEDVDIPVNVQDIPSVGSEGQQAGTNAVNAELPEGYVYDYQVSLEPIPQEIADLGGMCVGTMHAFPSRIMVGLMKQRMEEDPELKAEVEKRVEEVKQSLSEEIGGEFEVEIMLVEDEGLYWRFFCKEKKTDYEFSMTYLNYEYYNSISSDNLLYISDYYEKHEAQKYETDIQGIINPIYESGCTNIWCQEGAYEKMDIDVYIVQFLDDEIDYKEEQYKIIQLWKSLQEYDNERDYDIYIGFYPPEYEELIGQRCEQGNWTDIYSCYRERLEMLIEQKEIYDIFLYSGLFDEDNPINMDTLLDDYKNGTYDETVVWDYWVKGEN